MKERVVRLMVALVATAFLLAPGLSFAQANPCAAKTDKKAVTGSKEKTSKSKTGAANPCAANNPCAAKTDKKAATDSKEKAAKSKTGAANPCAPKK